MENDTELAARLARLEARRQAIRPAVPSQGAGAARRRRPHAARRSRIGVTIGSVVAMAGMTGAMALADQASSAADSVSTETVATVTAAAAAGTSASTTASTSVATTVTAAAVATPSTTAAVQSNGS